MNVLACTYILLTRPGAGGGWWGGPGRAGGIVRRRSSKAAVVGCWRRIVDWNCGVGLIRRFFYTIDSNVDDVLGRK